MPTHALSLDNVTKSFGNKTILQNLNLSVPDNSVFAFLGNNGEGKSTTIRVITGLMAPDSGSVRMGGKLFYQQRRRWFSSRTRYVPQFEQLTGVGALIDSPSLYPNLTAAEFLSIGCRIKQVAASDIDRVLSVVSMMPHANELIGRFSLGMKQRLAIAHALIGEPKLLILDEPTNGLDPSGIQDIRRLLASLPQQTNTTVFFSTHNLDEVEKIASHFAVLKNGRIRAESTIGDWQVAQKINLSLEVNDAAKAHPLLQNAGFDCVCLDTQRLQVKQITRTEQAQINALIISGGFDLYQSSAANMSLEQWFTHELTE